MSRITRNTLGATILAMVLACGGLPSSPRGAAFDVPALNQRRAELVGTVVTVRGHLHGLTRQGRPATQLNVGVGAAPELSSETILCIADPKHEAEFDQLQGTPITVHGRVSDDTFFETTMLTGCRRGPAKKRKKKKR